MIAWLWACAPGETAPIDEAGTPDDTAEVCATVTWTDEDGATADVTEVFRTGEYVTLDTPGTVSFCPGTWFARIVVRADVIAEGLGDSPDETILSAGELGTILDVAAADMTVGNVTLDRGAGLDVAHNSGGGGIYCAEEGTVTAEDVVFSNSVANDGAGLYADSCTVTLRDVAFHDNASDDDGGALTLWYSTATLQSAAFSGNSALDGGAAAIFYSTAFLRDVAFSDNSSTHFAGGVWASESSIVVTDSIFEGNVNTGEQGGGLLINGQATLTGVSFHDNRALVGGGLFVYYQAVLTADGCDFTGNLAEDVWVADYSEAGGYAMSPGADASFACRDNRCE